MPASGFSRARSGAASGLLRFLYVGTLSLRKGLPYLLEAWRYLKPGSHAQLYLVGSKELDVVARLKQEPGIRYLGLLSKDELRHAYRQADVLVLPTLCEGLAHSVLEALSFGLPVITTEASGAGHLIRSGENGFIVPSADAEALATAMAQAVERRAELPLMGERSTERARGWTVANSNAEHLCRLNDFLETRA